MLLESNTDEVHNPVETMAVEMTLHVPVKRNDCECTRIHSISSRRVVNPNMQEELLLT